MKKGLWFLLSVIVIFLDQASKYWVSHRFIPYSSWPVFPTLNITLAYNTGAAFGFLNTSGDWHKLFFTAFSVSMSLILIICLWRAHDKRQSAALSFILGGAVGNVFDRFLHGYVIDFIDFYYDNHHFATFNLADSAIFIGAVLLFFDFLKMKHPESNNQTKKTE